jgi:MFS family permease
MVVLGLLPIGVALGLASRGSALAARGALLAAALFAPGRAIADAQLAVQGSLAARPELVMPTALLRLHGAIGLWLLLAGEALILAAGLLAIAAGDTADLAGRTTNTANWASRPADTTDLAGRTTNATNWAGRTAEIANPAGRTTNTTDWAGRIADTTDLAGRTADRKGGYQGPVLIALGLGVVAALGLITAPFTADTPFLLANGVLDGPSMALAGGLLIAVAAPLAATIAVTSADPAVATGWLLGGSATTLAIAVPRLVAGLAVNGLHPTWGPYVTVLAALVLATIGIRTAATEPTPDTDDTGDTDTTATEPGELHLPGQSRLHVATGVLGLVAAGAALVGADTNLYLLSADLPHNTDLAGRLLVPAAVLIGVCAIGMLIPRWAFVVRPAFAVAWAAVLLAGFGAVDTALTATQIPGVTVGIGAWATGLAMLAALAAACCAGLAGGVERDDVDLTELPRQPTVLVPAVVAAVLAVGAFGFPVLQADNFTPPGLWSDFRFASWGLVFCLIAVIAAALLAPVCRPQRAAGLLLGAAGVVGVRVLSLPLNHSIVPGAGAGLGMLFALGCLVVLLIAATMAGLLAREQATKPEQTTKPKQAAKPRQTSKPKQATKPTGRRQPTRR